jgi:hypothetical protein
MYLAVVSTSMFERLDDRTGGRVVGYRFGDRVSEADFQEIVREMEAIIDEHGAVRLSLEFDGYPIPDIDVIDDDLKFWWAHRKGLERYAVVGEGRLLEWSAELGDRLSGVDVQFFAPEARDEA